MKKCPICDRSFEGDIKICEFDGSVLRDLAQTADPLLGTVLGERYKIIRKIGHGSISDVYLAEQLRVVRKVLVKILSEDYARDESCIKRFHQEAKLVSSLNHPRLIQIYDFDSTKDGMSFIVTEYVQGLTLKQKVQGGRIEIPTAVRWATQLADGFGAAHSAGVIHRDISPDNIVVIEGKEDIKIMDFGFARLREAGEISRLTQVGTVLGNSSYMAPEQIEGREADERTDIYSLGIVLYEILCNTVPFTGPTPTAVWMKHLSDEPIPPTSLRPEIPPALEQIVLRALHKNPEQRWQRMADVADALHEFERYPLLASSSPIRSAARPVERSVPTPRGSESGTNPPSGRSTITQHAERAEPPATEIVPRTVFMQAIDSGTMNDPSHASDPANQTMVNQTLAMTQTIGVIDGSRFNLKWLGLSGAALVAVSLAIWFAFVSNPPSEKQTTVQSKPVDLGRSQASPAAQMVAISIDADKSKLVVGERASLRISAQYNDGSKKSFEDKSAINWSSSNPAVATADARGMIDAIGVGTTDLRAHHAGLQSQPLSVVVQASARQASPKPTLVSLAIKAARARLAANDTLNLQLSGKYSDGRQAEIKSGIRWESTNPAVATINPTGIVLGKKPGRVELVARYGDIVSEPLSLLITPAPTLSSTERRNLKDTPAVKSGNLNDRIKIARSHNDRGDYAAALNELAAASKLDPNNKEVQAAILDTKRACKAERQLGRSDLNC